MKTDLHFRHPASFKTGKEKVTVSVFRLEPKQSKEDSLAPAVAAAAITLALSGIQEFLSKESEKYTQKYKGNLGVTDFFKDDGTLKYDGIFIEREVQLEEGNSTKDLAAVFSFRFERSDIKDQKVFRLVAKKPKINFSKCKTPKMKGTVDARVKLIFEAVWFNGEPKKQIIHEEEFDFHDIELKGKKDDLKGKKDDRESSDKGRKDNPSFENNEMVGSWIPFFPKEAALNIRCEIVESDEAGKKFEQGARLLKDNKETISGMVGKDS